MDTRRQWFLLAGLVCLSAAVQAWSIHAAVVPAIDSVRWLSISQALERDGVVATWQQQGVQPVFPLIVRGSDWLIGAVVGNSPHRGALAVQIAAAVPLILAVVPVYLFTLLWLGRRAALAGALLFCVLPEVAKLGAEGLADSTHLFFFCIAVWCLVEYCSPLTNWKTSWLMGSGASLGLAALTCPQALLIAPAVCLGLGLLQARRRWRQPWLKLAANLGGFAVAMAAVLMPYLIATHALAPEQAWQRLVGWHDTVAVAQVNASVMDVTAPSTTRFRATLADGSVMSFARKETAKSSRFDGHLDALNEYLREIPHAFHYVVGLLALMGITFQLGKAWRAADVVMVTVFVVYSLAAIHHAATVGYLSTRHLVPLVPLGLGWAGRGAYGLAGFVVRLRSITRGVTAGFPKRATAGLSKGATAGLPKGATAGLSSSAANLFASAKVALKQAGRPVRASRLGWPLVCLTIATCLPRTLSPIHAHHAPHRAAADWLVESAPADGRVLDTHGWTALYTNRTIYRYDAAEQAFNDPLLAYVVAKRYEIESASDRGRTLNELLRRNGQKVASFADPSRHGASELVIYRWYPRRMRVAQTSRRIH